MKNFFVLPLRTRTQHGRRFRRSIFAFALALPAVLLASFIFFGETTTAQQTAEESVELTQEPLAEVSEEPPPLTYEDVYAQWLTLQSELGRLADRLTLRTNSAQEAQSAVLPSERMALHAQLALSSGNISGASELIAQTQEIVDSAERNLDVPIDDPSFIPIPAQQIFDASAPEQIAYAFREKQNALNFFDQFERELMSSLSLSLLPNKKALS